MAAAKLQELFGLAETPRVGPRQVPVIFELLAPNGRPVQTTRDLRSFWENDVPRGAQGAARPLPAAPVARGPLDRRADPPHDEEASLIGPIRGA